MSWYVQKGEDGLKTTDEIYNGYKSIESLIFGFFNSNPIY